MKTPGHSKSDTVEAKANQFADTTVKEATLNTGSAQPRECSLLYINPAKEIRFFFYRLRNPPRKKRNRYRIATKRENFNSITQIWFRPDKMPLPKKTL